MMPVKLVQRFYQSPRNAANVTAPHLLQGHPAPPHEEEGVELREIPCFILR